MNQPRWQSAEFRKPMLDRVLALRAEVFSQDEYGTPRWEWEYEANPQGPSFIRLAVDRETPEKLAGHYAVISYRLKTRDAVVAACQSLDTFTNPSFRNQGIFVELAEETFRASSASGVKFVFGFPNGNSLPGFVRKLGFVAPFGLFFHVRPLRLGYFTRRLRGLRRWDWLRGLRLPSAAPDAGFHRIPHPPADWSELARALEAQASFQVHRDLAYLRWRYLACPDRRYELFELRRNGRLHGFAALRIEGKTGYLVDLAARSRDDWEALVRASCRWLREAGAESAVTLVQPGHLLEPILRRCHFYRRGACTTFILRALGGEPIPDEMKDPGQWFLMPGDTDYF